MCRIAFEGNGRTFYRPVYCTTSPAELHDIARFYEDFYEWKVLAFEPCVRQFVDARETRVVPLPRADA